MKRVAVLGGTGFIGSHVAKRLKEETSSHVIAADQYAPMPGHLPLEAICDEFIQCDLRVKSNMERVLRGCQEAFLFAADMGGMGYLAGNDFEVASWNIQITISFASVCITERIEKVFFASSACVYPEPLQKHGHAFKLAEDSAWPADPQDGYGLEKLFSERMFEYSSTETSTSIRIARFHNIFGPNGTWYGGREKAPAAFLRKFACLRELQFLKPHKYLQDHKNELIVWGTGGQRRSFCFITDAVDAVLLLMNSDAKKPVNIGSDRDVSILDLSHLCEESFRLAQSTGAEVPIEEPRLQRVHDTEGPIGVDCRSSDNKFIKETLGWEPLTSLEDGLNQTAVFIVEQHRLLKKNVLKSLSMEDWIRFNQQGVFSTHVLQTRGPVTRKIRLAIVLPLTSKRLGLKESLEQLENALLKSFWETTQHVSDVEFMIFVGIDDSDSEALCQLDIAQFIHNALPLSPITVSVYKLDYPAGSICRIWTHLSQVAYQNGADFFMILGDDVVLETAQWPEKIIQTFTQISTEMRLPLGFGCVALNDVTFPGMPTFPIVGRMHFEIFGHLGPHVFVNQGLDPYLFALYRPYRAARFIEDATVSNRIGGEGLARYNKKHVYWTGPVIQEGISRLDSWIKLQGRSLAGTKEITLDVIVPSFRGDLHTLEAILGVSVPEGVCTMFIIIFDNPADVTACANYKYLLSKYGCKGNFRIRMNDKNLGAAGARNRGLYESTAEWVLFLDDDVTPCSTILDSYTACIKRYLNASGFVGTTLLPTPQTITQAAVKLAGVTYFWSIAQNEPLRTDIPWGVTANIVVRRTDVLFDESFPKSGGGEDIDFCLRTTLALCAKTTATVQAFVAVPDAVAYHPWWDDGNPKWSHFFGWARGDGALAGKFPAISYLNALNSAETIALCIGWSACQMLMSALLGVPVYGAVLFPFILAISNVASDFILYYLASRRRHEFQTFGAIATLYGFTLAMTVDAGR
ncbi:hypothetical protein HDU77_005456, partial [Chytriomyces hyalinus]